MGAIQERIAEVAGYQAKRTAREDFDEFWSRTLDRFASKPLNGRRERAETMMQGLRPSM